MYLFDIQFFADGGGEGAASSAATGAEGTPGVGSADAGQSLQGLGVPASKVEKWAKSKARRGIDVSTSQQQDSKSATGDADQSTGAGKASFDSILKDPDYKAAFDSQVQGIVQNRLAKVTAQQRRMEKLAPALEFLATKYKLDTENLDDDALVAAIMKDDSIVEDYADERGTSVETARADISDKLELARLRRESKIVMDRQSVMQHVDKLHQQAEEVKQFDPDFDVDAEIANNAVFARMTSPQIGMSVADAYFATHRKEILAARDNAQSKQAIEAVANTIRAGQSRPRENGVAMPATITNVPYSQMSKSDRESFKNNLRRSWARGEKPGPSSPR